ncbi:putative regulator of septum formation [Compostimonas suwonensis]|uniref:Putative regulator of septum formation n=2 Tax=Compostimonas suwonensis TaxID=1048394 RepID=A0A2M9C3X5_9MICO|nr:putative regulator of septum formation [Compostimonas suwonensis]
MSLRISHPRVRLVASLAAAAAVVFSLSACSVLDSIFPAQAQRDSDTAEVSEAGQADAFTLLVGDCYNDENLDATEVSEVPAVPCAEPHDNEVYYTFDIPDATYPGEDSILTQADAGCEGEFPNFIGMAYADSSIEYSYLYPSEGSWKDGDREVVCIVYSDTQTTGSLKGAAI